MTSGVRKARDALDRGRVVRRAVLLMLRGLLLAHGGGVRIRVCHDRVGPHARPQVLVSVAALLLISRVHPVLLLKLRDLGSLDGDAPSLLFTLACGLPTANGGRLIGQRKVRACHQTVLMLLLWVRLLGLGGEKLVRRLIGGLV